MPETYLLTLAPLRISVRLKEGIFTLDHRCLLQLLGANRSPNEKNWSGTPWELDCQTQHHRGKASDQVKLAPIPEKVPNRGKKVTSLWTAKKNKEIPDS